jgi:hypothetical protein
MAGKAGKGTGVHNGSAPSAGVGPKKGLTNGRPYGIFSTERNNRND